MLKIRSNLIKKNNSFLYLDRKKIINIMYKLLYSVHANRVWIFSLWKDDKTNGYSPIGHWYCDFEVVDGLPRHAKYYQRVPIAMMAYEFYNASENGFSCMSDTGKYEGRGVPYLHMSRGAGSYYGQSLYTRDGEFIGGIGCDWINVLGFSYSIIKEISLAANCVEDLLVVNFGQERKLIKQIDWDSFLKSMFTGKINART